MNGLIQKIWQLLAGGSIFLLAACNGDEKLPEKEAGGEYLEIEVLAGGYVEEGGQLGRAWEEGNVTFFSVGDRVGVTVFDGVGGVLADNIPYKYNGNEWIFDDDNNDGKTICYYSPGATCLVYYPYRADADGVMDESGLKRIIVPVPDQSGWEEYRSSDLMYGRGIMNSKTVTVTLHHAYPSLMFSLTGSCTVGDGGIQRYALSANRILVVNVTIGDVVYYAHKLGNKFICIIPDRGDDADEIRYFGLMRKNVFGNVITAPVGGWAGNTRYSVVQDMDIGEYSTEHVMSGDFCCRTEEGKVYFIPGEAERLNDAQKKACQGIVFYVRDETSPDDKGGYEEFNSNPRGYILSLDENTSQWATSSTQDNYVEDYIINGYYLTYVYDYNKSLVNDGHAPALQWCRNKTRIENSASNVICSKWYMISCMEMEKLSEQFELININMDKAGGIFLRDELYFTVDRVIESVFYAEYARILNPFNGAAGRPIHVTNVKPYRAACAFQ